jgi:gliding motility-associated lipoprotein GldH
VNKLKLIPTIIAVILLLQGCANNNLIDINMDLPENNWVYAKSLKSSFEIKEVNQAYQVYFKLRHTAAYRYSNLYVLVHLKGPGIDKHTRYQFKVAKLNGEWLGKGSGDIYTYNFPLLTDFRFASAGKYTLEIEQNMRDNPLVGVSDVGITVENSAK